MFDAVAAVARAIGFEHGGESIKSNAVRAIADGVKSELKSCAVALDGHLFQTVRFDFKNSRGARVIRIWREHRCGARAERAIHDQLCLSGLEPRVSWIFRSGATAEAPHFFQTRNGRKKWKPLGNMEFQLPFPLELV